MNALGTALAWSGVLVRESSKLSRLRIVVRMSATCTVLTSVTKWLIQLVLYIIPSVVYRSP